MARPPKEINWKIVVQKMEAGCPAKEIFSSLECQVNLDTFYRRFKEEFGCSFQDYQCETSQKGEGDLRLMLHGKAMQGNVTALMFLAKCRLGMKEPETTNLLAPNQQHLDQSHFIMQLQNKILELEQKNDSR